MGSDEPGLGGVTGTALGGTRCHHPKAAREMVGVHIVSAVRLRRWAIRGLSKAHLAVYRMTRRVLGSVAGMPVLLLTTTGRRSERRARHRSRSFAMRPTSW